MFRTINRNSVFPLLVLSALAAPLAGACSSNGGDSQAANAEVLDPTQAHYGNTDAEWGALWWKWIYETPRTADDAGTPNCAIPFLDPTGASCGVGQSGDVFFLAGAPGGTVVRDKCEVPSGKAIFFPIFNFAADNGGVPPAMQLTDSANMALVQNEMAGVDVSSLSADFDGAPITNLARFATQVTKYSYIVPPEPNTYTCAGEPGVTGPVDPSYAAGYYIMLSPPTPGAHTLHFTGTSNSSHPSVNIDITYHLTVK